MHVIFVSVASLLLFVIFAGIYFYRLRTQKQRAIIDAKMCEIADLFQSQSGRLSSIFAIQVDIVNGICDRYFAEKDEKDVMRAKLYREVCIELRKLNRACNVDEIVRFLNETRDNIVEKLDTIPDVKDSVRMIAIYTFLGLTPKAVSILCDISSMNVYTLRSRLKNKIEALDSPYKEELSHALGAK